MEKQNLKIQTFIDGVITKLKNKRLYFRQREDGSFYIQFKILKNKSKKEEATCKHSVIKDRIHITEIGMSEEGLEALLLSYLEYKKIIMNQKEFRVYIVSADYVETSAYDIQNWKLYEERHNVLLQEAKDFIAVAEESGTVYSLQGFQDAMNIEHDNLINSWIYITNNY